ncbi:MAG: pitrilysin family protein [Bacteriovoracales bacterium]|nr:pitrilysin family protein [Bacteriovoracales bacterium]
MNHNKVPFFCRIRRGLPPLFPLVLFILFGFGCSLVPLQGPPPKAKALGMLDSPPKLVLEKKVFPNGLTSILIENRKLPLFSLFVFVKIGSRHERPKTTGAAHYLEHMMFKGSKNYGAGEFEKVIAGNGGTHNAYTTKDLTVYHESLPINALDNILKLEADRLFHLSLEKNSFEKERFVILEEKKLRLDNSPRGQLLFETLKTAYRQTPYAHATIGLTQDIKTVSQEEIRDYFETFYDPANIVIVLSGDFKAKTLMPKMKTLFGRVPSKGKFRKALKKRDANRLYSFKNSWDRPKSIELYGNSPLPLFMAAYPSFPKGHQKSFAMDLLAQVLGGSKSSYLSQKYVHGAKPPLGSFQAFHYDMEKSGLLLFTGQLLKGKGPAAFRRRFQKDLKGLCHKAVSVRAVEKVKNQYLTGYFHSFETNSGLAELVGLREVLYGDPFYFHRELKRYLETTPDQIKEVCRETLEKNSPLTVSVWNKHRKKKGKGRQ